MEDNFWTKKARTRTTRRRFLAGVGVVGTGLAAGSLVGCGDDDDGQTPTATLAATASPTQAPASATPIKGGTLNNRVNGDPLDWQEFGMRISSKTLFGYSPVLSMLLRFDPYQNEDLVGDLAEDWENPEPTEYVFNIRENANWHDGQPVTAADVIYSLQRVLDFSGVAATSLQVIDTMEAVDNKTVRIKLSRPSQGFLLGLANMYLRMLPESPLDPSVVTGSGPFKVTSFTPDVSLELERNPDYYIPDLPYLDKVSVKIIKDNSATVSALRDGQIDSTWPLAGDFDEQATLEGQGFSTYSFPATRYNVTFNDVPPFDDERIRKAIHLAIDRQSFLPLAFKGDGWLTGPNIPAEASGRWGLTKAELEQLPGYRPDKTEDIAEAKRLLAEAGGLPSMDVIGRTSSPDQAAAFADLLNQALGIEVNLDLQESSVFSEAIGTGAFTASFTSFLGNFDDPSEFIAPYFVLGGSRNYGNWSFPEIDQAYAAQDQIADEEERLAAIKDLSKAIIDKAMAPLLGFGAFYTPVSERVQNYPDHVSFFYTDQYRYDRVWLA